MAPKSQLEVAEAQKKQVIEGLAAVVQNLRSTAHATEQLISILTAAPLLSFGAPNGHVASDAEITTGKKRKRAESKRVPKAERDPNEPKRPPSAYLIFQNHVRKEIIAKNPSMSYKDVLQDIAATWKAMKDDEKAVYHEAARIAKDDYKLRKDTYDTKRSADAADKAKKPTDTDGSSVVTTTEPGEEDEHESEDEDDAPTSAQPKPQQDDSPEDSSEEDSDEDSPPAGKAALEESSGEEDADADDDEEDDDEEEEQPKAKKAKLAPSKPAVQSKKPPSKTAAPPPKETPKSSSAAKKSKDEKEKKKYKDKKKKA